MEWLCAVDGRRLLAKEKVGGSSPGGRRRKVVGTAAGLVVFSVGGRRQWTLPKRNKRGRGEEDALIEVEGEVEEGAYIPGHH